MTADHDASRTFEVESGVSVFDGKPFVIMRWGGMSGQATPAEARQQALHMIEAADAAEHDAALVAVLRTGGLPVEATAEYLLLVRKIRESSR